MHFVAHFLGPFVWPFAKPFAEHPAVQTVTLSLVFLLAVVASEMLARALPGLLPRPLVQVALGAAVAAVSGQRIDLQPDVFFLLFVPPLLFLAGWRIPKDRLYEDRNSILGMALGLVFLTVVGIGFFLHWMIPSMPIAVAFAVAAVVSPTDPIAVSGIAQKVPVPKRMMNILEGESLLNDASGLVCLRFAIAAALTGSFSLGSAALQFLWVAAGGLGIGIGLCWATVRARSLLASRFGEESGTSILVALLIPFAAYLAAERVDASGILAAAAAGITMSFASAKADLAATTRVRGRVIWEMLDFTLNGIVFVLLGTQLPNILADAPSTASHAGTNAWMLAGYVAALMLALIVIRFCWAWLALQLTLFRERHGRHRSRPSPPLRVVAAVACAGARGAITLAGVLTLPLALADGTPLPERDVAIFLASGVILLSLAVASLGLPSLLKGLQLPDDDPSQAAERAVRVAAAHAAIARIDEWIDRRPRGEEKDRYAPAARRVTGRYRARIDLATENEDDDEANGFHASRQLEQRLQQTGIEAERETIAAFREQHQIDSELAHRLLRELDLSAVQSGAPR